MILLINTPLLADSVTPPMTFTPIPLWQSRNEIAVVGLEVALLQNILIDEIDRRDKALWIQSRNGK